MSAAVNHDSKICQTNINWCVAEELEVLSSIYCKAGELTVESVGDGVNKGAVFIVVLQPNWFSSRTTATANSECMCKSTSSDVQITICVPLGYPEKIPNVVIHSKCLMQKALDEISNSVSTYANTICGRPILLDLVVWIQDYLKEPVASDDLMLPSSRVSPLNYVTLLHIDHMRNKTSYVKTIKRWTDELVLTGLLLIFSRLILVLLNGSLPNIKEFLIRLRTANVDVDSRGRPCKERMMSVLCDPFPDNERRFTEFLTVEMDTITQIRDFFSKNNLSHLYMDHVERLLRRK